MAKKNKLVIRRKKWLRGEDRAGFCNSTLRNEYGSMCCLGFACKQLCELENNDIEGYGVPSELTYVETVNLKENKKAKKMYDKLVEIESEAIRINDAAEPKGKEREELLKKLFGRINVDVIFKD